MLLRTSIKSWLPFLVISEKGYANHCCQAVSADGPAPLETQCWICMDQENIWNRHLKSHLQNGDRSVNTLRPRQNGCHFPNDLFKCIFLNENVWILIKISLKFVHKGPISNNPALVQIMAWRRPGDKPLSEPRMENLVTHICVTLPQWVKVSTHLQPFHWLVLITMATLHSWFINI